MITAESIEMKYDVQPFLKKEMPGLINLLGTQNISWTSINRRFAVNMEKINAELKLTQKTIFIEATFYSIIINKYWGNGEADGMFDWYCTIFESLSSNLTDVEKRLLRPQIYSVLIELNKGYLNFIGELATLNEIKKSGKYELINVEELIQSGSNKSADFLFLSKGYQTKILVEVVNLHVYLLKIVDVENIKLHIEGKLREKMRDKFINPKYEYYLQPVMWTKSENELELLATLYKKNGLSINNVHPPFAYSSYKNGDGTYDHHFDMIC
jgi:hypothetical protein